MNTDKALANFYISDEMRRSGDTGRGRVEHRSFEQLRFTLNMLEEIGDNFNRDSQKDSSEQNH